MCCGIGTLKSPNYKNMPSQRDDYEYLHITASSTNVVVGVACKLIRINVNTTAASAINVYNAATSATSITTNLVGILKASILEGPQEYGIKLATGLTVVTLGNSDITVVYATA